MATLDRSTLAAWVGKAAHELKPVFTALIADLKRSSKLFMEFVGDRGPSGAA